MNFVENYANISFVCLFDPNQARNQVNSIGLGLDQSEPPFQTNAK